MHISVDSDTQGVELYHLSILFQSLAKDRGFAVPVDAHTSASQTSTIGEMSVTLNVDTSNATSAVEALADLIDRTGVKVEDVPPVTVSLVDNLPDITVAPPVVEVPVGGIADNLDSAGLPWDARIHAGSRERNTDGSWRVRRRPKGVEESEWEATLARVTSELRNLMEIPVADAAAETVEIESGPFYWVHPESSCCGKVDTREELNEILGDGLVEEIDVEQYDKVVADGYIAAGLPVTAPVLTDADVDTFVDIIRGVTAVEPPVAVAPPVVVAPPAIEPPVTVVAPPIPTIETFAQVMTYLTARTPKDEAAKPAMVAKVNEILAANSLTVLTQLGQRPDLIPQVMAQFTEAFGE